MLEQGAGKRRPYTKWEMPLEAYVRQEDLVSCRGAACLRPAHLSFTKCCLCVWNFPHSPRILW